MYLNQVSQQAQQQQQQQQQLDPFAVAQLQQQQQQVLAAQQAALYGTSTSPSNIDALDIPQQSQMGHQQSASISNINGFQSGTSGAPMVNGLLAPARSQHNRAVSLPVFAQQQENGAFQGQAQQVAESRRGHQYQGSFSGAGTLGNGNGYGLAIQDQGMNHGLNGWTEEEVRN